jgi:DNA repair protein REV1
VSIGASRNVLLAKLALRQAKPDGQYYLHSDIDKFLGKTPIKNLPGIGRSMESKLLEVIDCPNNVALVENIRPLSKSRLMTVFGEKTGVKLYNYCRGIDDSSIEIDINDPSAVLGRKSVSVDVNFGIRFTTMDQVDNFMMRIAKELYTSW